MIIKNEFPPAQDRHPDAEHGWPPNHGRRARLPAAVISGQGHHPAACAEVGDKFLVTFKKM